MSESIIRKTLTKGVGRKILGLFLIAAIVPMLFTGGLAFYEFNRSLETEAARSLKNSAKEYGVEILTRLELATEKATEVIRIVEQQGIDSVSDYRYMLNEFEAIWVVGENGPPIVSVGNTSSEFSRSLIRVSRSVAC